MSRYLYILMRVYRCMRYWGHVRKTAKGGYYVVIPAAIARTLMKEHSLLDLDGKEVRVEVAL